MFMISVGFLIEFERGLAAFLQENPKWYKDGLSCSFLIIVIFEQFLKRF